MTDIIYRFKLWRAKSHAQNVKQRQKLSSIYHSNDIDKKKISSSKLFLGFILGDFLLIQIFCMFFMFKYPEYSDIGSFIGIAIAVLGQVGAVLGYFKKSTTENTVGGIIYETAIQQMNTDESVG